MEPYVPESDLIIFAASLTVSPEGNELLSRTPVIATLTSLINKRGNNVCGWMADMTTTLTVNTAEVENKTHITCRLRKESYSTFLYIAKFHLKKSQICIVLSSLLTLGAHAQRGLL